MLTLLNPPYPSPDEDASEIGDLDVLDDLSLWGWGMGNAVIRFEQPLHFGSNRILHVLGSHRVELSQLTLENGVSCCGGASRYGGAAFNDGGDLRITGSILRDNRAYYGGAVASLAGHVRIEDSVLEHNHSIPDGDGGALFSASGGSFEIVRSDIRENFDETRLCGRGMPSATCPRVTSSTAPSGTTTMATDLAPS